MVETLSGTFNAILGGTYITCCYTFSENYSVKNSPWGGGGSIASSRPYNTDIMLQLYMLL